MREDKEMKIEKVALIGAGAVGAYFIWGLSEKLGGNFCVVAKDERKDRLEREGLRINGEHYTLNVKTPEEAAGPDLLLIASKHNALEDILPDIQTIIGKDTIILSLLNGVISEEIIGKAVGMEHLLYSLMRIDSRRIGNNIVFPVDATKGVYFGEKDSKEPTDRVLAIEELFDDTPINYVFMEDIITDMWLKYASNIAQNLPQAVLGVGYGAYEDSAHMVAISAGLWREVALVAQAKGIELDEELRLFGAVHPSARFSTLQDLDAKRHTEIEIFAGEMMRMGKEYEIPVPYCEYTYHVIKALEEKNDGKFDYGSSA